MRKESNLNLQEIPKEIFLEIVKYIPVLQRLPLRRVSKFWRDSIKREELLKNLFKTYFPIAAIKNADENPNMPIAQKFALTWKKERKGFSAEKNIYFNAALDGDLILLQPLIAKLSLDILYSLDLHGNTAFYYAALNNHPNFMNLLFTEVYPQQLKFDKSRAKKSRRLEEIFWAIACNKDEVIQKLLLAGDRIFLNDFPLGSEKIGYRWSDMFWWDEMLSLEDLSPINFAARLGHQEAFNTLFVFAKTKNLLSLDNLKQLATITVVFGRIEFLRKIIASLTEFQLQLIDLDNVKSTPNAHHSLLDLAAQCGHFDIVKLFITNKDYHDALLLLRPEALIDAFCHAWEHDELTIAKYLIKLEAITIPLKEEALKEAIEYQLFSQVTFLYSLGVKLPERGNNNETPLHKAIRRGFYDLAFFLIEQKPDVNLINNSQQTPLHLACEQKASKELILALLNAGAQIDALDQNGNTPLHLACTTEINNKINFEVIKILLEKGADINALNSAEKTPYDLLPTENKQSVKTLAINHGLKINGMIGYNISCNLM